MGLSRMHVPVAHWLAGTLTLDGGDGSHGSQSSWRRMTGLRVPLPRKRTGGVAQTTSIRRGPHLRRIFGRITTFTHFLHRLQTQQHQRLRLNGTLKLGYGFLARNDATFQNHYRQ